MTQHLAFSSTYLPLNRNLDYINDHITSSDFIEMIDGQFGLQASNSTSSIVVFSANEQYVSNDEYRKIKAFYEKRYSQQFKFKHPTLYKIINGEFKESPNSQQIIFTPQFFQDSCIYYPQSVKITKNGQIIYNYTLNPSTLEVSFSVAPTTTDILNIEIEYDYKVMFDSVFGLKTVVDNQLQGYNISFKLIAI